MKAKIDHYLADTKSGLRLLVGRNLSSFVVLSTDTRAQDISTNNLEYASPSDLYRYTRVLL